MGAAFRLIRQWSYVRSVPCLQGYSAIGVTISPEMVPDLWSSLLLQLSEDCLY